MKYNPLIHHRRSIRLKEYDYSRNGAYHIVFCVKGRHEMLGKIAGHEKPNVLQTCSELVHMYMK